MKLVRVFSSIGLGLAALLIVSSASAQAAKGPPVMPHDAQGREQCLMCHGGAMEGMKAAPADHKGRTNDSCPLCHAKESVGQSATAAAAIPHDTKGREQCLMCHGGAMEGMKAAPANHKGIDNKNCALCHTVAAKK
ncbi:MAG: hypothetical protein OER21_02640 [Gemmatimonadota bacterium]|nr:hypothetical protein [Gemmatimonadota bacterium]